MIDDRTAQQVASRLETPIGHARELATKLGLDPYPVNFWIVDHNEMNQVMAYEGFQERYHHWRWGMQYDQLRKADQYRAGKAYEIVNNDNPASAFLQESNTMADQKAVITHVLAHADFFKRNNWFETIEPDEPGASAMVARHARHIRSYMEDPDIDHEAVERWIDHILCLTDTIDQHRSFTPSRDLDVDTEDLAVDTRDIAEHFAEIGLRDEIREAIFDDQWLDSQSEQRPRGTTPTPDVLAFLRAWGKQYDVDAERAVEMEPWQRDVLEMLRAEAYYFAPQRMTQVMNEGWGAYYESIMMADEGFATSDEVFDYADHLSKVLGSEGFNPYTLGKQLWEYIENTANRREVLSRLLQVEGLTWRTLPDVVDFRAVRAALEPPEAITRITPDRLDRLATIDARYLDHDALEQARAGNIDVDRYPWKVLSFEGLAWRNYSLLRPQHHGFLSQIGSTELERIDRYRSDPDRYGTIDAALEDVDYTAGWTRMHEVRESHNDVTFLDEFLTKEFVDALDYFTFEYDPEIERFRVASTEYEAVKEKLLVMLTNFGKPRITVLDGNYENRNELLLGHLYNGIMLDLDAAERTLERVFELWGRPVNLKTIVKTVLDRSLESRDEGEERGLMLRYDGESFDVVTLTGDEVAEIDATLDRTAHR